MRGDTIVVEHDGIRATVQQGSEDIEGASLMERAFSIFGSGFHIRAFLVQQPDGQRQVLQATDGHV